jgi:hypothetical protein
VAVLDGQRERRPRVTGGSAERPAVRDVRHHAPAQEQRDHACLPRRRRKVQRAAEARAGVEQPRHHAQMADGRGHLDGHRAVGGPTLRRRVQVRTERDGMPEHLEVAVRRGEV